MTSSSDDFALPLTVEGGVEKVPRQYRGFYEADQTGTLHLSDPVLKRRLDDTALKGVVSKERERAKTFEKAAKAKDQLINQILGTVGAVTADELPSKIEELLGRASSSAHDAVRTEIEGRYKQTYGAQVAQKETEIQKLRKTLHATLIDGEATKAIAAAKGNYRALMPHVTSGMRLVDEDGQLAARVVDEHGNTRYADSGLPMSAGDLVSEMKRDRDFAGLFESSGSSGSGSTTKGGASGAGNAMQSMTLKKWQDKLSRAKPDERTQLIKDYGAGLIQVRKD